MRNADLFDLTAIEYLESLLELLAACKAEMSTANYSMNPLTGELFRNIVDDIDQPGMGAADHQN